MTFRMMTSAALAAIVAFFSITGSRLTAQTTMPAPVTITEDEVGYILDNGIIKAWISRKSGDLVSMKYKGTEMLGTFMKPDGTPDFDRDPPGNPGRGSTFLTDHMYGFWSHDAVGPRTIARITIDPKTNGGERAEVSVKGFSDGTDMGHGPGAGAAGDFAGDIDIRYTLGRGESGLYTYCEFDHVAEYPDATMGEARFCVKLNSEIFDWMLVNNHHNQMYPMELERDGDDKYNYTTNQWENPAFGWAGYYRNVGFFFVNASVEYLTGPPTKVEFLCHRDTTAPMYAPTILNYWRSSHYGGGSVDVAKGEKWKKVIGPFLLYCNTGPNPQAIFADAQAQQKKEAAKWPYNWVDGVDYPKKNERSTVKGQLILSDPLMPGATMSYVRVGLTAPDYRIPVERAFDINSPLNIHWQVDAKHYSFWVRGTNDGAFEIPAVRAGKYTLHAIADGVLGEYAKTDIVVEPGKTIDLGKLTWTPVRRGKQVWDIGIPNRNGSEFVKGDDFFHPGMGLVYAYLFPDDVNFVIGKSDFRKDWFYLHVPHASEAALTAAANSPPRAPRGAGRGGGAPGAGGPGGLARGRGASTLPGFAGGRGAATQPAGNLAGAPATQPGGLARGGGGRGRGGAPGGAPGGGAGGGRATPYSIVYDMPAAPRGKATLRFGIATANISGVNIELNGESLGRLEQLHNDSAIGRNGISGIWTEREFAFDASKMKAGTNTLKLIVPAGALGSGIIYDYIRLELDESAKPTAMVR